MKIRYAVIGSGALGGYYGGKLAHSGQEVHFLFHSDYHVVKNNGLRVDSAHGNFIVHPANAYSDTRNMPVCDVVLVCLKTNNNALLKEILPPLLHKNTQVILIQNGLNIEQALADNFPELSIAGGLAFICSSKTGPGFITHYDQGKLTLGGFQKTSPEILEQVIQNFKNAGVLCTLSEDLNQSRWEKLVWNIPYNGMTVVLNTTTDRLMKNPDSRSLIRSLMTEVMEASIYCGARITGDFIEKMLVYTDRMVPYAPSMKLDYDAGRPMEIEAIYSNPVRTALKAGYTMKKVEMLEQQLRFLQDHPAPVS